MNRHQRRAAPKAQGTSGKSLENAAPPAEMAGSALHQSPGLALRLIASILLSPWMLRRVRNAEVLGMLREVARQAGRDAAVRQLTERLNEKQGSKH